MTIDDYLNLIPSRNRQQPNFIQVVTLNVSVSVLVQNLLTSMIPKFDVDLAVGDQLDIIGQWVGISRDVAIPIIGVYFTWDGDYSVGWDYGTWQPFNAPTSVTVLPDDSYRTVIKAKIAANSWIGTTEAAYAIWAQLFPQFTILIQDNQNMSYDLIIVGGIVDSLTLALLAGGYISLKPEGVRINNFFVPVVDEPGFAWDMDTDLMKGWDEGYWLKQIPTT
jgi:Protein of unknown function (DUF2612)